MSEQVPRVGLFRVDANATIGGGHAMRCLALAQNLMTRGWRCLLLMDSGAPNIETMMQAHGIDVRRLVASSGTPDDAAEMVAVARAEKADFLVIDGYHFDVGFQIAARGEGLFTLLLDDTGELSAYDVDVVLNQNLHADAGLYLAKGAEARLLLGAQYVLLRDEFRVYRKWQRDIAPVGRKVLVTFGAGDPAGMTPKVVAALHQISMGGLEAKIVLGPTAPVSLDTMDPKSDGADGRIIEIIGNPQEMAPLMAWADVAVSAAGSTCGELAFMGLPSLVMVVAPNQAPIADSFAERGAVKNLGRCAELSEDQLANEISALLASESQRRSMSQRGGKLMDGLGTRRVSQVLEQGCARVTPRTSR